MDHDVVDSRVIFAIAKCSCRAYESLSIQGKTHGGAVFEGSFQLVAPATAQVGDLKEMFQFRPIDVLTAALETHSLWPVHVRSRSPQYHAPWDLSPRVQLTGVQLTQGSYCGSETSFVPADIDIILPVRIGEVAKRAGVSVQAIRFYERRRLLRTPRRTAAGYRIYSEADLEMVTVIKKMQRFGFKLVEIRRVLQLWILPGDAGAASPYQPGSRECLREALKLGEKKLAAMNEQIRSSVQLRDELEQVLKQLRAGLEAPPKPVRAAEMKVKATVR